MGASHLHLMMHPAAPRRLQPIPYEDLERLARVVQKPKQRLDGAPVQHSSFRSVLGCRDSGEKDEYRQAGYWAWNGWQYAWVPP